MIVPAVLLVFLVVCVLSASSFLRNCVHKTGQHRPARTVSKLKFLNLPHSVKGASRLSATPNAEELGDEVSSELEEVKRTILEVETDIKEAQTQFKKAVKDGNEKMTQLYGEMVIHLRRELVELRRKDVELRKEIVELRKEKNKLIPDPTGKKLTEEVKVKSDNLDARSWIERVFTDLKPGPSYFHRNTDYGRNLDNQKLNPACIIDSPNKTMSIDLIDWSPEEGANQVLEVARLNEDTRTKALISTIRGQGGGKTRAMEEIRRYLLHNYNEIMPIAVTYNSRSQISNDLDLWSEDESPSRFNYQMQFALSLVLRMAASFSGLQFHVIKQIMNKELKNLNENELSQIFIQEFVCHLVRSADRAGLQIDTVILLIDEVVAMEKYLSEISGSIKNEAAYPISVRALHDSSLIPFASTDHERKDLVLNAAVAITSLKLSLALKMSSGRTRLVLKLPYSLNVDSVVNLWSHNIPRKLESEERLSLKLLASMMNSLPRLVEIVNNFLSAPDKTPASIDSNFLMKVINHTVASIDSRYNYDFPNQDLLYSIIFQEEVALSDPAVIMAIEGSIITNPIEELTSIANKTIICESSLLMLSAATGFQKNEVGLSLVKKMIRNCTKTIISDIFSNERNRGDLLEKLVTQWIAIRVAVAEGAGKTESTNLAKLLGLDEISEKKNEYFFFV